MFEIECAVDWEKFQERLNNEAFNCYADWENLDRMIAIGIDEAEDFNSNVLDVLFGGDWYFCGQCDTSILLKARHSEEEARS